MLKTITLSTLALTTTTAISVSTPSASNTHTGTNIVSLSQLNVAISQASTTSHSKKVGFLSEGNYQSVQNELDSTVEPKIYENITMLTNAVKNGDIIAGLVSGTPANGNVNVFSSEQISVRAMLVRPGAESITDALDAALVRFIESGGVEKVAAANPPYEALVVHSCKPTAGHFAWPTLAQLAPFGLVKDGKLKIASLGPYDWGVADGNYKVTPAVGFWPDYYTEVEKEFVKQYGITFERVWYPTSAKVMAAVHDGICHTTEPYMMLGSAASTNTSRKTAFDETCITSATNDKYFTKLHTLPEFVEKDLTFMWIIIIVSAIISFFSALCCSLMFCKERNGSPLFKPLVVSSDINKEEKVVKTMELA